jgi:hypothetical protein
VGKSEEKRPLEGSRHRWEGNITMHLVNKTNLVHKFFLKNINILRKICAPSLFNLQDYTEMHGQQNVKITMHL